MSDSTSNKAPYQPGLYAKGDTQRVAQSTRAAVALVFEGYTLVDTIPAADASYADLQEQAKAADIPANQSSEALRAAIAEKAPAAVVTVDEPSKATKPVPTPPKSN